MTMTAKPVEGVAKLKQQTTQLMAALSQGGQGMVTPVFQAVPDSMGVDVGIAEEPAIVDHT